MSTRDGSIQQAVDLFRKGFHQECRRFCLRLLRGGLPDPELHQIAAAAFLQLGKTKSAEQHLRTAASLAPSDPRFPAALAEIYLAAGRVQPALARADQARGIAPADPALILLYARCCMAAGMHRPVIEMLQDGAGGESARKLLARAWAYEGRALTAGHQHRDAAEAYEESLKLDGAQPAVLSNLGGAYVAAGYLDAALACFRRAIDCDPAFLAARSNLLLCLHYASGQSAAESAREHQKHGRAWEQFAPHAPAVLKRMDRKRLRVGFVSSDLRQAPVARFVEPILRNYDRRRFHMTCYYTAPVVDGVTRRLRALPDRWREIAALDDVEASRQIRADGCDILIDLNGHTHGNRLGIFALRSAPVQATYLGYPDTTGIPSIDYRITDAICDPPPGADRYCVEKLIRVPQCFLCYQPSRSAPRVSPLPADISGGITFGCFNQLQKLSHETMLLWVEILCAVPGARLLLKAGSLSDARIAESTRERFGAAGVDPARLELRGYAASEREHLAAYGEIDVALDPFPYGGTTTTCEALWMGVPVITLRGRSHVARVGASLLGAVELNGCIAGSKTEYLRRAVEVAADREGLRRTRRGLRGRMRASVLCDQGGFAKRFEGVMQAMWRGRE